MKKQRKLIILICSLLILALTAMGVTYAIGTADTPESSSEFTITIGESTETHRIIPGKTDTLANSSITANIDRDAWLFASVIDNTSVNGTDFVSYGIADGWSELKDPMETGENVLYPEEGGVSKVYYRSVLLENGTEQTFQLFDGGTVTYPATLGNNDLAGVTGLNITVWAESVQQLGFSTALGAYKGNFESEDHGSFRHVFPNTDTYLYRVGNGNAVKLGSLFNYYNEDDVLANDIVNSPNVKIKVTAKNASSSVAGSGTNLEDGSSAKCVYTAAASDWQQSTLKFTGEGPVSVEIWNGNGDHTVLNLEVVTANNFEDGAVLTGGASIVMLGNASIGSSSGTNAALTLSNKSLYGNGFTIDATNPNASTKGHGIITLANSSIDNVNIIGPEFDTYASSYNNDQYASTLHCASGTNNVTNCRITGAASPLRIMSTTYIDDTVLSGGFFANMIIRSGNAIVEDLTTIGTGTDLGIVFDPSASAGSSIVLNGELTQHNFISQNANMTDQYARMLKNKMFDSDYARYQFTSGGTKYVNAGIISMTNAVGAGDIIDNRADKKNYSGSVATMSIIGVSVNGYVYTMENTDPSMLETSYQEPAYDHGGQIPYAPVFTWAIPSGQSVPAGGDLHYYKDNNGTLQIQFLTNGNRTVSASSLPSLKRYGADLGIAPSITCTNDVTGVSLPVTNGNITFAEAGEYTITYHYENVPVYDYELGTTIITDYVKTIPVIVAVKKQAPNAVINVTSNEGVVIWGGAGSAFDRDYQPAAQIFDNMTITDYDDDGNPYTVLDGDDQAAFLNNIASIEPDSDNKTGFTINFPDGTKLAIKCGAPYNGGTLQFKKYNNKFLMVGSVAYNNPTAATWKVTSYTYTGRNGVAVKYTTARNFKSTTDSTYYTLSNLSTNRFLMYNAQGGTVNPPYASTSPATLPLPTRDGYTFLNWNTASDGSGTGRTAGTSYSFSATTTLYAIWAKNVEISFSSEGSIIDTVSGGAGTSAQLPSATQSANWLEGWYMNEDLSARLGAPGENFVIPAEDTIYYANWMPKYGISYNANGGTCATSSDIYEGTPVVLPAPVNGSKTFEGWFTAASGGTRIGTSGDTYVPTGNIELFAQWSDNILVTFNGNGGTADTGSISYDNVNPIILPGAAWAGHVFNGWYAEASGGTKAGDPGDTYTPSAPVELFAHWTAYTVTYNANGGTVSPASTGAGADGTVTLPTPTRTGYTFNGWYTAATDGIYVGAGGDTYTPSADISVFAHWTVNKYTVTITTNNSSTALTVNGTTVSNGGQVAYDSIVKVVLSYTQTNSLTFTIKQGNTNVTRYSDASCTTTTTSAAAGTYYYRMPAGDVTINSSSAAAAACITGETLITLADGTQKPVKELTGDEMLLAWDLETGRYTASPIVFIDKEEEAEYTVITAAFSNGSSVEVISEHGFFDLDRAEYVYLDEEGGQYIGDRFVTDENGIRGEAVLTDVTIEKRTVTPYSPVTYGTLCYYTNGMLSMPGGINGLFNIFDVDTNALRYDADAMASDINNYGLLTLDDYQGMITEEAFGAFNGKYLGISIAKGILTWDDIEYMAERYIPLCN